MSQEVEGEVLGDQFKGYVFKIMGGNDKQGFPMKQGVLTSTRVQLLMGANTTCYRPRRHGERKRKSIRGCIVAADISVVHLVVVKKGEEEIPGLTDRYLPRRLGPKRASKIRKLFALSKEDDVRKYVIRRTVTPKKEGRKPYTKAPKIQRLVTPVVLQRKRHRLALKKKRSLKNKQEASDYAKLLAARSKERKEKRSQSLSQRKSQREGEKVPAKKAEPASVKKAETAPAKKGEKAPTKKAEPAPVKKAETAPTKKGEKAPAKKAEKAPAKKAEAAPAKKVEKAPAKKAEAAPAKKAEPAPAKKAEKAPAKKAEPAPAKKAEPAPAKKAEPAPVKKAEAAPVKKTEKAPVKKADKAPGKKA